MSERVRGHENARTFAPIPQLPHQFDDSPSEADAPSAPARWISASRRATRARSLRTASAMGRWRTMMLGMLVIALCLAALTFFLPRRDRAGNRLVTSLRRAGVPEGVKPTGALRGGSEASVSDALASNPRYGSSVSHSPQCGPNSKDSTSYDALLEQMTVDLQWNNDPSMNSTMEVTLRPSMDQINAMKRRLASEEAELKSLRTAAERESRIRKLVQTWRHEMRARVAKSDPDLAHLDEEDELADMSMTPRNLPLLGGGPVFTTLELAYSTPRKHGIEANKMATLYNANFNTTHSSNWLGYGPAGVRWVDLAILAIEGDELLGVQPPFDLHQALELYQSLGESGKRRIRERADQLLTSDKIRNPPLLGRAQTHGTAELLAQRELAPAPLVLLATSLHTPSGRDPEVTARVVAAQLTLLQSIRELRPEIDVIAFTDQNFWHNQCREMGIISSQLERTNPYGLPYLRDMMLKLERDYLRPDTQFYGYVNSDIVFDKASLVATIQRIQQSTPTSMQKQTCKWFEGIDKGLFIAPRATCEPSKQLSAAVLSRIRWIDPNELLASQLRNRISVNAEIVDDRQRGQQALPALSPRVLITGRRVSILPLDACSSKQEVSAKSLHQSYSAWIRSQLLSTRASIDRGDALDYFIVTRNTFNWVEEIPDLVIGRAGFDNWLVWWAKMRTFPNIPMAWPRHSRILQALSWFKGLSAQNRALRRSLASIRQSRSPSNDLIFRPASFQKSQQPPAWMVSEHEHVSLIDASQTVIALHLTHPQGGHSRIDPSQVWSSIPSTTSSQWANTQDLAWNYFIGAGMFYHDMPAPYRTTLAQSIPSSTHPHEITCTVPNMTPTYLASKLIESLDKVELIKCVPHKCAECGPGCTTLDCLV